MQLGLHPLERAARIGAADDVRLLERIGLEMVYPETACACHQESINTRRARRVRFR
jgi:hypothetical protein